MNDVESFLETGIYKPHPGQVVPLLVFSREFCKWLGCPAKQLYWTQFRRIERALAADLGFAVGYAPSSSNPGGRHGHTAGKSGAIFIANILGPASRNVCGRMIVLEDSWLVPSDLTDSEQAEITKHPPAR